MNYLTALKINYDTDRFSNLSFNPFEQPKISESYII